MRQNRPLAQPTVARAGHIAPQSRQDLNPLLWTPSTRVRFDPYMGEHPDLAVEKAPDERLDRCIRGVTP